MATQKANTGSWSLKPVAPGTSDRMAEGRREVGHLPLSSGCVFSHVYLGCDYIGGGANPRNEGFLLTHSCKGFCPSWTFAHLSIMVGVGLRGSHHIAGD